MAEVIWKKWEKNSSQILKLLLKVCQKRKGNKVENMTGIECPDFFVTSSKRIIHTSKRDLTFQK